MSQLIEPSSSLPPVLGVVYQNQKLIVRDNYLSCLLQFRNVFLVRLAVGKH